MPQQWNYSGLEMEKKPRPQAAAADELGVQPAGDHWDFSGLEMEAKPQPRPTTTAVAEPEPVEPVRADTAPGFLSGLAEMVTSPVETARDVAVATAKGVIGLGEATVGLADIATLGRAGKLLEETTGFDPALTNQFLSGYYSESMQRQQRNLEQAEGFVDTAVAALSNPRTIGAAVAESLPIMGGGAAIARKLVLGGMGAAAAGAIGEGIASGGATAETIRQQAEGRVLSPTQAALSVASGAGTSVFGMFGARLAKKLGIVDVETMLAGGLSNTPARRNLVAAVVLGAVQEGFLEEFPQSVQEQVAQNMALDRPWHEGVSEAAVMGSLAGVVMGGGAQGAAAAGAALRPSEAPTAPPTAPPDQAGETVIVGTPGAPGGVERRSTPRDPADIWTEFDRQLAKSRGILDEATAAADKRVAEEEEIRRKLGADQTAAAPPPADAPAPPRPVEPPADAVAPGVAELVTEGPYAGEEMGPEARRMLGIGREPASIEKAKPELSPTEDAATPSAAAPPAARVPRETPAVVAGVQVVETPAPPDAEEHDYSSTQVNLPDAVAEDVQAVGASIEPGDLAEDGVEDQPHVTVRFGLHSRPETLKRVTELLAGSGPITVTLGKTSVFPASETGQDYDVVKADVDSPDLKRLNTLLGGLPNTETHAYTPHVTIAYVKPGTGEKYAGRDDLEGTTIQLGSINFTRKDESAVEIPLTGPAAEGVEPAAAVSKPKPAPVVEPVRRLTEPKPKPRVTKAELQRRHEEKRAKAKARKAEKRTKLLPAIKHADTTPAERANVGRMLTALESSEFVGKQFREVEGQGSTKEVTAGASAHPIFAQLVGRAGKRGVPTFGWSRAKVEADLTTFLDKGKRSAVSDAAVELARRLPISHAAVTAPEHTLAPEPGVAPRERVTPTEVEEELQALPLDELGAQVESMRAGRAELDPEGQALVDDAERILAERTAAAPAEREEDAPIPGLAGLAEELSTATEAPVAEAPFALAAQPAVTEREAVAREKQPGLLGAPSESLQRRLDAVAEGARRRVLDRLSRTTTGIPVDAMPDLVIYGAAKIAGGTVQFAQWSKAMVKEFGDRVKPKLKAIYDAAKARASTVIEDTLEAAPVFYSTMARVISEKFPKRGFKDTLQNILKKGGISQEEVQWSGIEAWLEGKKGPVEKQDVLDFLDANQLRVEEVTLGEPNPVQFTRHERDDGSVLVSSEEGNGTVTKNPSISAWTGRTLGQEEDFYGANGKDDALDWVERLIQDVRGRGSRPTKFAEYVLAGGENYRELLITMPVKTDVDSSGWRAEVATQPLAGPTVFNVFDAEGSRVGPFVAGSEETAIAQAAMVERQRLSGRTEFTGGHFDEPNVLAHVRFNERTDSDGKRVLFVEEVQSDWHQTGRKEGYRAPPLKAQDVDVRFVPPSKPDDPNRPGYWEAYDKRNDQFITRGSSERAVLEQALAFGPHGVVPDAPFKTTWPELSMKRMLRYAAEGGFDSLAWTTGTQQVERYDSALRNAVDRIEWTKTDEGVHLVGQKERGRVGIEPLANGMFTARSVGSGLSKTFETRAEALAQADKWRYEEVVNTTQAETTLSDAIGKAMARQILESKEQSGSFEGDEIHIDSTGMASFYDRMLPSFMGKYGKKWGAKVGTTDIQALLPNEAEPDRPGMAALDTVHSLPITDEMRQSVVYGGQPLFGKAALKITDLANRVEREAKARIKARGTFSGTRLATGLPIDDLVDLTLVGVAKMAKGAVTFAEFSAQMVADVGDWVKPHLREIYDHARTRWQQGQAAKTPKEMEQILAPRPIQGRSGSPVPATQPIPRARLLEFPSLQKLAPEVAEGVAEIMERGNGFEAQRRGVQTWERTEALSRAMRIPLKKLRPGTAANAEELAAYADAISTTLAERRALVAQGADQLTQADLLRLSELSDRATLLVASYRGLKAEAGRGLGILRRKAHILDSMEERFIETALKAPGFHRDNNAVSEALTQAKGDPAKMLEELRRRSGTFGDLFQAFYYNSILSGVRTHLRNLIGNSFNIASAVINPVGAAPVDYLRAKRTGASREVFLGEVETNALGAMAGVGIGWKNATFTFRRGYRPIALQQALEGQFDVRRVELPGISPRLVGERVSDWSQLVFNSPSRALEASDEFFRSAARQMERHASAYAQARREGLTGPAIPRRSAEILTATDGPDVKILERIKQEAEEFAARAVFQERPGEVVQAILKIKNSPNVAVRSFSMMVAPFVRTPSAILRQGAEFSPLGFAMKAARQGGRAGAQAQGRAALGTAFAAPIVWAAAAGLLTGAPPSDSDEREEFYAEGKLPNAVRIGDYWVRYVLFQPFSVPAAAIANAAQGMRKKVKAGETLTEGDWEGSVAKAIAGAIGSILDQSFMQGLGGFIDAVNDPERYGSRWLARLAQGFVPASGLLRNISAAVDPTFRRPGTLVESVKAIIPGLSRDLVPLTTRHGEPAQRTPTDNWILRGFVVPQISRAVMDKTTTELARLGVRKTRHPASFTKDGKRLAKTDPQKAMLSMAVGYERKVLVEAVVNSPPYNGWRDERKVEEINAAYRKASTTVRNRLLEVDRLHRDWTLKNLMSRRAYRRIEDPTLER